MPQELEMRILENLVYSTIQVNIHERYYIFFLVRRIQT